MYRLLLLSTLFLAAVATPAVACINDSELPAHEREFKSDYNTPSAEEPSSESSVGYLIGAATATGVGGTLLVGALALGLMRFTRREDA